MVHDLNIDNFKSYSPDCACTRSLFIYNPVGHVITGDLNMFQDATVTKHPSYRHDRYVVVLADNAHNNIVAVCNSHYKYCFINELGIASSFGNPTLLTKGDSRLDKSVLCSFGIATIDGELDLSSLY